MESDTLSSPFHSQTNMKINVVLLLMERSGLYRADMRREPANMAARGSG